METHASSPVKENPVQNGTILMPDLGGIYVGAGFATDLNGSRAQMTKKATFISHIATQCCLASIGVANTS